jgi:hypothetical protein
MNEFILAWLLITTNGSQLVTYSPPVATLEDCQRMQSFVTSRVWSHQCVQVRVMKGK